MFYDYCTKLLIVQFAYYLQVLCWHPSVIAYLFICLYLMSILTVTRNLHFHEVPY